MIMMKNWMSSLKGLGMHWAATAKTKKTQSARSLPTLVNDNLRFEARNCELFMVPKHPKLAPGSERSVVIDTSSVVLQLFFVKKSTNKVKIHTCSYKKSTSGSSPKSLTSDLSN